MARRRTEQRTVKDDAPPYHMQVIHPDGRAVSYPRWRLDDIGQKLIAAEDELKRCKECQYLVNSCGAVVFEKLPSDSIGTQRCINLGRQITFLRCMQLAVDYLGRGMGAGAVHCLLHAMCADSMTAHLVPVSSIPPLLPKAFIEHLKAYGCGGDKNFRTNNSGYLLHMLAVSRIKAGATNTEVAKDACRHLGIEYGGKKWQTYADRWRAFARGAKVNTPDACVFPPGRGRPRAQ